jgi:hypothetical protein
MAIFPRFGTKSEREADERKEKAKQDRESNLKRKATSKVAEVGAAFTGKADDAFERLSSQFAALEENKKQYVLTPISPFGFRRSRANSTTQGYHRQRNPKWQGRQGHLSWQRNSIDAIQPSPEWRRLAFAWPKWLYGGSAKATTYAHHP